MNYHDQLRAIERERFDEQAMQQVRSAEQAIVQAHSKAHSGILQVPAAVVARDLKLRTERLHKVTHGRVDYDVAQQYVIARSLANCVSDNWNPKYQPE